MTVALKSKLEIFYYAIKYNGKFLHLRDKAIAEFSTAQQYDFAVIDDYLSFVNRMIRNNFLLENITKTHPEIQHGA